MAEKRVLVKLLGNAKAEYLSLHALVREEREKGIPSSFHQTLLRSIDGKIALLKANYDYGTQVPRRFIPRAYVQAFEVTNLWKVDLAGYWRLLYTLKQPQRGSTEVDVLEIWLDVLDIVDHPTYDKLFGYRKK